MSSKTIGNEKDPLVTERDDKQVSRYQKHRQTPQRTGRALHLSLLLVLAAIALTLQRYGQSGTTTYRADGKKLPDTFVICSDEGRKVYTVPEQGGVGAVECLVVRGKMVIDVGSKAHVRRKWASQNDQTSSWQIWQSRGLRIFTLPAGHSITPGMIDSHGHPIHYGMTRQLPLVGSTSIEEVIKRVETFAKGPGRDLPFIEGSGWDQNLWPVKDFPTAADLETSILRGRPVVLQRIDAHAIWVSRTVLDMLGELPDDVEGGQIVRDVDGNPTGVFLDNAIDLVEAIRPPYTEKQYEVALERMMDDALSKGMTGVHDARLEEAFLPFFKRYADEGRLRTKFYSMLNCDERESYCGDRIPMVDGAQDGRFTMKAVKLFADGALGSRGAALSEDYSDEPGWQGFLLTREEIMKPLIKQWYEGGWQVNVHAIGDKANHVVLDGIEEATGANLEALPRRFRLEHAQIMTQADLRRAVKLGVIASYQPTHATSDMRYAEDRLGPERIKGAYAWRTYLDLGGRIALGSDFPVESIDPLRGFYAAVTRLAEDGTSPHGADGWYPEEKLSREEALRGFTVDGAYASFSNMTGSLTPGKRFDAVIWDDDLMTVPQEEILEVEVKGTVVDGRLAYGVLKG